MFEGSVIITVRFLEIGPGFHVLLRFENNRFTVCIDLVFVQTYHFCLS